MTARDLSVAEVSGGVGAPADPAPSGRRSGDARGRGPRGWRLPTLRRAAAYVAVVGLGVVFLGLLAVSAQRPGQPLDPDGPGPGGAMALAEVLRDQGVEVDVVRSIGALESLDPGTGTTVVVGDATNLGPGASIRLRDASRETDRLVVVGGDTGQLDGLGLSVDSFLGGADIEAVARCDSAGALPPDVVSVVDVRYIPRSGDAGGGAGEAPTPCFALPDPDGDPDDAPPADLAFGAAMVVLAPTERHTETVLLGFGSGLSNERITEAGHAGVAVRTLGSSPRLVWFQPGPADLVASGDAGAADSGQSVWPVWTTPVIALIGLVVVLLAVARGRRLGRLVHEPLPVVVRAVETTESRGRLYRRAGDRPRAATVLRAATVDRLRARLALPRAVSPMTMVDAVSRATGVPADGVGAILYGAPPADDDALIALARQLSDLEERVRHP